MARTNKNKLSYKNRDIFFNDNERSKKADLSKFEVMTFTKFILTVLWGTVAALTFTLLFTSFGIFIFLNHYQNILTDRPSFQINDEHSNIVYYNDKAAYRISDAINLDIVNNSDESIYLAPCEYFNKFEKKVSGSWQPIVLDDCTIDQIEADNSSIEKISKKAEDTILANRLGEGIWRGVSNVYFGCQRAEIESCRKNKKIYTNEFIVGDPEIAAYSVPQY